MGYGEIQGNAHKGLADLSTIELAILRLGGAEQEDDPYETGTLHKRAYLRSLTPVKLAGQACAEVEASDDKEELYDSEAMLRGDTPLVHHVQYM